MIARLVAALVAAAVVAGSAAAADLASEPVEKPRRCNTLNNIWLWGDPTDCPGDETVPACDAPSVVKAAVRFADRAQDVYRVPDVVRFVPLREAHDTFRNPSPLVRRYCVASVELTNGDHTKAYYFIEEDSGFVGLSWSVYVCIAGYDNWRVYDGRCRVARPAPRF
jgi:hypothetical protein